MRSRPGRTRIVVLGEEGRALRHRVLDLRPSVVCAAWLALAYQGGVQAGLDDRVQHVLDGRV